MPIYEYQCQQCGVRQEALQKLSDPPLTTCERCGGALKRLISSPAVQFKGSGWYVTDYARRSGGAAGGEGRKSEGAGEGSAKAETSSGGDKAAGGSSGSGAAGGGPSSSGSTGGTGS
jgi:putative FmdB family regulatory protein